LNRVVQHRTPPIEKAIVPLLPAKACDDSDIRLRANAIKANLNNFICTGGHKRRNGDPVNAHGMIADCIFSARK
jgi:hypothetical protein